MDIVYFIRPGKNEELRYSLRSLKNLPHDKVWVYGSCPEWCSPDHYVHIDQVGNTKWDRVKNMYQGVCDNPKISDDFILMNDDFFIMEPVKEIPIAYRASLYHHIIENELTFGLRVNAYARELLGCLQLLKTLDCPTNSYELHIPIIFNKKMLSYLLKKYPEVHATRSLYSNYYRLGGEQMADVKVNTPGPFQKNRFLSTTEESFEGLVGDYIKKVFPEKGDYETN